MLLPVVLLGQMYPGGTLLQPLFLQGFSCYLEGATWSRVSPGSVHGLIAAVILARKGTERRGLLAAAGSSQGSPLHLRGLDEETRQAEAPGQRKRR